MTPQEVWGGDLCLFLKSSLVGYHLALRSSHSRVEKILQGWGWLSGVWPWYGNNLSIVNRWTIKKIWWECVYIYVHTHTMFMYKYMHTHTYIHNGILFSLKKGGSSLGVQWIRICLPMQGTQVWSLIWEDSTCRGAAKPVCHNYWAHVLQLQKSLCI